MPSSSQISSSRSPIIQMHKHITIIIMIITTIITNTAISINIIIITTIIITIIINIIIVIIIIIASIIIKAHNTPTRTFERLESLQTLRTTSRKLFSPTV